MVNVNPPIKASVDIPRQLSDELGKYCKLIGFNRMLLLDACAKSWLEGKILITLGDWKEVEPADSTVSVAVTKSISLQVRDVCKEKGLFSKSLYIGFARSILNNNISFLVDKDGLHAFGKTTAKAKKGRS